MKEFLFFSAPNENIYIRTKVHANNTVQKCMISTVALQIGGFIMKMIRQGCLDNMLVISCICFSFTAIVTIMMLMFGYSTKKLGITIRKI